MASGSCHKNRTTTNSQCGFTIDFRVRCIDRSRGSNWGSRSWYIFDVHLGFGSSRGDIDIYANGSCSTKVGLIDIKIELDKVFKKIATKTHPDKLINQSDDSDRLVELYKEAQQSVDKKDWSRVTQIAEELEIDISDVEENDSVFLEKSNKSMEVKIDEIKHTFAWLWSHSDEKSKPQLKKQILNVMGVKEKENGNK